MLEFQYGLVAQAIMNRWDIANGRLAVIGRDRNIYWSDGSASGTTRASVLGFSKDSNSLSDILVRAAAATDVVDGEGNLKKDLDILNNILGEEQGDTAEDSGATFAVETANGGAMYVSRGCYSVIRAMQITNDVSERRVTFNSPGLFVTSWNTTGSNRDSAHTYSFGRLGSQYYYGFAAGAYIAPYYTLPKIE